MKNGSYSIELLEPRRMLDTTINGTENADTITVEYSFDIINHWHIVINGSGSDQLIVGDLVVNGLGGADQIEIIKTFDRFCTVSGGAGDDMITVGGGDFNDNFREPIKVFGNAGNDTLVIRDGGNTGNNVGLHPVLGQMVFENDTFHTNCIADSSVENFVLRGGSGDDDLKAEVDSTVAVTSINMEGQGGDDLATFIRHGLTSNTFDFAGGSGTDTLHYVQATGTNRYTADGNSLTTTLSGQVLATWTQTQVIRLDPQQTGDDIFNVTEVNSGTDMSVTCNTGDDTYSIGGGNINANIRGTLDIFESTLSTGGSDTILFNDISGTTADEYTLDLQSFTKTGLASPITFSGIETRTLNANSGENLITVVPDPSGTRVNVAAGGSEHNTLIYGAGDIRSGPTVQLIAVTDLILQDDGATPAGVTDKDYTIDATGMKYFVNGALATTFLFQGLNTLNLFAGALNNAFTVESSATTPQTQFFAGGGADALVVNNWAQSAGAIDFSGEAGTDSITLNYSADTNNSYTITSSLFDKTGLGQVNWDAEQLNLTTGTLANAIAVQSLTSGQSITVSGGLGNDVLTVGTGDVDTTVLGSITFNGEGGTGDKVIVDDDTDTGNDSYTLTSGLFDKATFGSLAFFSSELLDLFQSPGNNTMTVNPGTSLTNVTLRGGDGADTYNVTPSATATITIDADGTTPFAGEALNLVNAAAAGSASLSITGTGAGNYGFASAQPIFFTNIESQPSPLARPSIPDLIAADDTGISSTDNITNKSTVTFTGTDIPNKEVVILHGTTQLAAGTVSAAGTYSIPATFTGDGTFNVTAATREPSSGLTGAASSSLSVTIDTAAPAAPTSAPHLNGASDTGVSGTDNITRDTTPTFDGLAPAATIVRLFANGTDMGLDPAAAGGFYTVTSSVLTDGSKTMTTRFEDIAGNQSASSPTTTVTIDTIAPTLSSTPVFQFATAPHALSYVFNENVGPTLDTADFTVTRQPATNIVTALAFNTSTRTATITFPVNGVLPDGRYSSTLTAADVTDLAGNALAADNLFNFLFMIADANNDGTVNLTDFNRLASNFGQSNRNFTQGDFNYDGLVNLADFNLLASRFGTSVGTEASSQSSANLPSRIFSQLFTDRESA